MIYIVTPVNIKTLILNLEFLSLFNKKKTSLVFKYNCVDIYRVGCSRATEHWIDDRH